MSKVWVKLDRKSPIKVDMQDSADVDDLIKAAIDLMKLQHPPQNCEIKLSTDGEVVRRGMMVRELLDRFGKGKSDEAPLLLVIQAESKINEGSQQSLFRFFLPYNFAAEKFRRSLQNAQVTEDSQNGKVLTFTVPPPWLSTQNCTSIFIRSAYEDIYRILESEPHNHFLILGNPGTGKSYFALYVLYRTFQESIKTVVFHRSSESVVFIFKKGEDVIQLPENLAASSSVVNEENVLYLFDAGTRKSSSVCVGKSRLIVFSSPSRENTCEFIKMGLINLYMPTWSKEELLLARKLEQYHVQVTEQHVNDLFEKFGGIARYVLEVEEQRRVDNYHKLDATISHCTLETIRSLGPDDTDDESPLIFHRTVLGSEYDNYEFKFASQYVSDKVVKAIQETAFDEMEAFVRCCDIVMPPNTSSLIRWLLEQVSSKIDDNTDWKVHQL